MSGPQFELQVGLNMGHDTGYSFAAYGSLVDGSVNGAPRDLDELRRELYALMDGIVERAKGWHH